MARENRIRWSDISICSAIPILLAFSALLAVFSHRELGKISQILILFLVFVPVAASFILLPFWAVMHIVKNRWRTPIAMLWIESILGGCWLAFGLLFGFPLPLLGEYPTLFVACLAGGAVMLTPYFSRRRNRQTP